MQTNERHRHRRTRHSTNVLPTNNIVVAASSTILTNTRTPDQLARDRALELDRLRRAIRPPPPGAMDTIRESTERLAVVEQYARFRERMDTELQQIDLGEPPSQAIECGVGNTRLPPGPSVEDISQWRTRELHELAAMQLEVADERRPQNYYHI
mgnify:CR=1 FL=1